MIPERAGTGKAREEMKTCFRTRNGSKSAARAREAASSAPDRASDVVSSDPGPLPAHDPPSRGRTPAGRSRSRAGCLRGSTCKFVTRRLVGVNATVGQYLAFTASACATDSMRVPRTVDPTGGAPGSERPQTEQRTEKESEEDPHGERTVIVQEPTDHDAHQSDADDHPDRDRQDRRALVAVPVHGRRGPLAPRRPRSARRRTDRG